VPPARGDGPGSADLASVVAPFLRPGILAGLAAAAGCLVLAIVLATNATGGTAVDASGRDAAGSGAPGDGGATSDGDTIVVDVVGAVLRPGVYHLPRGSRVGDAIAVAGGYGPRVAADRVDRELNLAALVHDGDQVMVPSRDDVSAGSGAGSGAGGEAGAGGPLIDLNTATEAELEGLPGIGPVTASKIAASRSATPFRSIQELLDRKLVGQKTFDAIKALVTVS